MELKLSQKLASCNLVSLSQKVHLINHNFLHEVPIGVLDSGFRKLAFLIFSFFRQLEGRLCPQPSQIPILWAYLENLMK